MSNQIATTHPVQTPLFNWLKTRQSGILLHPTSLPSDQGIGVLDVQVDRFLAYLQDSGISNWQVCPLGPTGYGDSPYQCFSSFAGNPYLIDLAALVASGLITDEDSATLRALPRDHVDYGWLYVTKWPVLFRAYTAAKNRKFKELGYGDFSKFCRSNASWLDGYGLFMALKDHYDGRPWWLWPNEHRFLSRVMTGALPASVIERAEAYAFFQYLFYGQWARVRTAATKRGIQIIGDAPIFVARDSADVWSRPELFQINQETGTPNVVAGVPPDYFSADGQLWGNPLYDWAKHAADGYTWWLQRLRANFAMCDVVRIDHFRAFDTYWSIPAEAKTAKNGEWKQGPGLPFFKAIKTDLPDAKLIAEDLGELFESVRVLRDACGLPGMTILQFAFGGDATNLYLPHNLTANAIVYPGTHDNNTTLGWYRDASPKEKDHVRSYLRVDGREIGWDFVRSAYAAVSRLAVIPMQDLLSLGGDARFNTPGVAAGNWQWRYSESQLQTLHTQSASYLKSLGEVYGRS
ncbi:MAG: hypothetical protein RIQ79_1832 [Verrucomicrobiota bacterium]